MKLPKTKKRHVELVLVSMIDMFTILIIYLLSQTSSQYGGIISTTSVQLPSSSSREVAQDTLRIIITAAEITVNSTVLVELDGQGKLKASDMEGLFVKRLARHLQETLPAPTAEAVDRPPLSVLIISDKVVPFETIRNVMFTAGQQTVADFRFAVLKKTGST